MCISCLSCDKHPPLLDVHYMYMVLKFSRHTLYYTPLRRYLLCWTYPDIPLRAPCTVTTDRTSFRALMFQPSRRRSRKIARVFPSIFRLRLSMMCKLTLYIYTYIYIHIYIHTQRIDIASENLISNIWMMNNGKTQGVYCASSEQRDATRKSHDLRPYGWFARVIFLGKQSLFVSCDMTQITTFAAAARSWSLHASFSIVDTGRK